MDFTKLFLGYNETKALEHLLIREGYINSFDKEFDSYDFDDAVFEAQNSKITCKSTLLRLLLLFEEFDSNTLSLYNLERIIEKGLISDKSNIASHGILLPNSAQYQLRDEYECGDKIKKGTSRFIKDFFITLDSEYKTGVEAELNDYLIKTLQEMLFYDFPEFERIIWEEVYPIVYHEFGSLNLYNDELYKIYLSVNSGVLKNAKQVCESLIQRAERISNKYRANTSCFNTINTLFRPHGKNVCKACLNKNSINECYESFCEFSAQRDVAVQDLFIATSRGMPLFNNSLKPGAKERNSSVKLVDDVYYLVKKNLTTEEFALPTPRSITEALKLRQRPEIQSFRKVFSTWCSYLQCNDEHTVQLIHKDFIKARDVLEKYRYNQHKKQQVGYAIKQNIFSIIFECIGMVVPFLSLPKSIAEPWIERKKEKERQESEWFILTR